MSAASSLRSSAPSPASGAKKRRMRPNSPSPAGFIAGLELFAAQRPGEAVEHAVRQARLLAVEKRVGDGDVFRERHARRDVGAMRELVGPGLEDQAQDGFKAAQRPFLAQGRGDGLVETLAMVRDPAHDVGCLLYTSPSPRDRQKSRM